MPQVNFWKFLVLAVALIPCAAMPCSWILFFFLSACICIDSALSSSSSSSTIVSYTEHCSSIVPESTTTFRANQISIPLLKTTYFTGGDRILSSKPGNKTYVYVRKSLSLGIRDYYETTTTGIHKVNGFLYIKFPYSYSDDYGDSRRNYSYGGSYHHRRRARGLINFSLSGFWSEISRKLCMVGSASWEVEGGNTVNLDAVLKLNYESENNPTIYTGVISGSLESTGSENDPAYFDLISIFSFPALPNYNYSLVSKEVEVISSNYQVPRNQSLSLRSDLFCSMMTWRSTIFELEYATECREEHQHCSPVGTGVGLIESPLPRFLVLTPIECSVDRRFRYMASFRNITNYDDHSFYIDSTVIGEALWDDKSNKLISVACWLLNPLNHFGNAVGDCTMRLSLRYPSILNIRKESRIVGQFWSSKTVKDSGYFKKIDITGSDDNGDIILPERGYEYTELDNVRKSCPVRKPVKNWNTYPDGNSYNLRFDMSIRNSKKEKLASGYATPLCVGNDLRQGYSMIVAFAPESSSEMAAVSEPVKQQNISYAIRLDPFPEVNSSLLRGLRWSMNLHNQVEITAEGVYNGETGYLCMVGCRKLIQNSTVSRDCEILVKLQFAPLNAKRGGLTKGTIQSTRAKTDPFYFDDLIIQSAAYYVEEAKRSIWRMGLEITMVLISNTLTCIFVGLQIFHVRRNPEVPSFISIVMLVVLSVGHMIPLVLNSDAVFFETQNTEQVEVGHGGKIEANEVAVRVTTMVAFLLQIRLLQLVWSAKRSHGKEKRAGFVTLVLYIVGGFLTLHLNWLRNRYIHQEVRSYNVHKKKFLWGDLTSYAGLILDGFLLPQILLNIFTGSAESALSHPFYIGISAIRLAPHAYNQYRAENYPKIDVKATYYFANPATDFYSIAWDIVISCGIIALAVIVSLQQRYGGRWVLPKRFRGLEVYEKMPTVDNE